MNEDREPMNADSRELRVTIPEWLSADLVFVTDLRGHLVFVNPSWQQRLGHTAAEVIGKDGLALVYPESHTAYQAALQSAASGQSVENLAFRAGTKNGGYIDVLANLAPVRDAQGHVVQILGSGRDITELKRIQERLASSEERLRVLFERAPDAYYLNDLMGTFLDGNKVAEELFGCPKEELLGKSFLKSDLLPRKQLPRAAGYFAQNAMGHPVGPVELRLNRKDGTQIQIEARSHPVQIAGQNVVLGIARDISSRKKVEESLKESAEKFKIIFEEVHDGIVYLDDAGCVLEVNRKALDILGQPKEQIVGKYFIELGILDPGDMARFLDHFQHVLLGTLQPLDLSITNQQGRKLYLECSTFLVRRKGGVRGVVILIRDVTESTHVEGRLAYLASFPEQNPSPVVEVDLDGQIRYANPAAQRLFPDLHEQGLEHPWLVDWATVVGPFREGRTDRGVRDVTVGERSYEQFFHHFAQDRFIRVYGVDVTQRKRFESRLARINECFLQQGSDSIENINRLTALCGELLGGVCALYNRMEGGTLCSLGQWNVPPDYNPKDKPEGHICHDVICGQSDDVQVIRNLASSPYAQTDPNVGRYGLQTYIGEAVTCGGQSVGSLCVVYQRDVCPTEDDKRIISIIASAVAVEEERRLAEAQQTELLQQLAGINQELQDFAHVVSHDLKAPLRAIKTLADWLATDYQDKLDSQGKENLQLLGSRVDRMQNLIDGVLQYSRIGRTEQGTVPVDLARLLREILDNLGVPEHIEVHVEPDLPTVKADATRITQVFQNLLSNAIKYMDKPQGLITVECVEEDGFWKFSVSDNGPGIERKHFEQIFKLFQTLARRDDGESTGVGLTVAKKIVEMYGGKIWVESEVGKGSTFFFTFPKQSEPTMAQTCQTCAVGQE
jgi:PAS domain S-box-containing protein